jgi:hypothetical protein
MLILSAIPKREYFIRGPDSQAPPGSVMEFFCNVIYLVLAHRAQMDLPRQVSAHLPDGVSHGAFLPGVIRMAEVEVRPRRTPDLPVMGEFGPVLRNDAADGKSRRLS